MGANSGRSPEPDPSSPGIRRQIACEGSVLRRLRASPSLRVPAKAAAAVRTGARLLRRRRTRYAVAKRGLDIVVCLLAMPFIVPLALLCAGAVKAGSTGPVFFRQRRAGRGGRPFEMIKFRTMSVDAEAVKAALRAENGFDGPDFKLVKDPRVTPVGHFLRRTSLDELPQVWNILVGDMTLVGPRPTSFGVDVYTPWHQERLEVTPGLTGLWQIKARGDTDFDERVRLDVAYVRERTLWLDISILAKTLPSVLLQRGAH